MEMLNSKILEAQQSKQAVDMRQWAPGIISFPWLSTEYCGHLIEKAEKTAAYAPVADGWEKKTAGSKGKEVGVGALYEGDRILESYLRHVAPVIKAYYGIEVSEILEPFVIKYSLDSILDMARHKDRDGTVSGVVRLNEGYEGCRLRFPDQAVDAGDIPVGNIVLFPHNFDHEVTALQSGERYSLAFWSK